MQSPLLLWGNYVKRYSTYEVSVRSANLYLLYLLLYAVRHILCFIPQRAFAHPFWLATFNKQFVNL